MNILSFNTIKPNLLYIKSTFLVLVAVIILSIINLSKTVGFSFEYVQFNLVFAIYFLYTINNAKSFFQLFLCLFLTLGFFVKINHHFLAVTSVFVEPVGSFSGQASEYSRAFIFMTIGFLGLLFSEILCKFFKSKDNFETQIELNEKKIFLIQLLLFLLILVLCFYNANFKIYQKGLVVNQFSKLNKSFFAWGMMFGFTSIIVVFLKYIRNINLFTISFLIVLSCMALVSVSLLSSTYIISVLSIFAALLYFDKKIIYTKYFFILGFFSIILFVWSITAVTSLRFDKFTDKVVQTKSEPEIVSTVCTLALGRWVGFEGVLAAVAYSGNRVNAFNEILFEIPKNIDNTSYYDREIALSGYSKNFAASATYAMTTPGFIGWASIPNNAVLLFVLVSFGYFIMRFIEQIVNQITDNIFFVAVIGQVLAYRFIHFGFMPIHTYKLFVGILLSTLITYIISLVISKTKLFVKH